MAREEDESRREGRLAREREVLLPGVLDQDGYWQRITTGWMRVHGNGSQTTEAFLSDHVMACAGLSSAVAAVLVRMNDKGASFDEIADHIADFL